MFRAKPKVLRDVTSHNASAFKALPSRINLRYKKIARVPFFGTAKIVFAIWSAWFLILGSVAAPTTPTFAADANASAERAALEAQLKDLESQIGQYQTQISSYQKQGGTLKGEINRLNANVAKLNLEIKAITLTLGELDRKITDTQGQIHTTENNIENNRQALTAILNDLYTKDRVSLVEVFLKSPNLSDFVDEMNGLVLVQTSVAATIRQITDLKDQLKDQEEQFVIAKGDAETMRQYQQSQKIETQQATQEKNTLLEITKGQESKYQTLLKQTKETAAQIRNRIFELLGGGQLSFEQAYQYAKVAASATGIRPAFLMAVLHRESALGQNVGKCTYKISMNPTQKKQSDGSTKSDQDLFLEILVSLGMQNPESVPVSCANADGAYGGAMGPAQFIPSTWVGFKLQIEKITGRTPANPWNNGDAFVAAALYLSSAGAGTNERTAAAKYYCGGRWNRYVCTNVYGARVIETADQFQRDIDTILE